MLCCPVLDGDGDLVLPRHAGGAGVGPSLGHGDVGHRQHGPGHHVDHDNDDDDNNDDSDADLMLLLLTPDTSTLTPSPRS